MNANSMIIAAAVLGFSITASARTATRDDFDLPCFHTEGRATKATYVATLNSGERSITSANDVSADDGNECTFADCSGGLPVHTIKPDGTPCRQFGGTSCQDGVCSP